MNLFENTHKLVLVLGTEVWRPAPSSFITYFFINPLNIDSFFFLGSVNIFEHLRVSSFSEKEAWRRVL